MKKRGGRQKTVFAISVLAIVFVLLYRLLGVDSTDSGVLSSSTKNAAILKEDLFENVSETDEKKVFKKIDKGSKAVKRKRVVKFQAAKIENVKKDSKLSLNLFPDVHVAVQKKGVEEKTGGKIIWKGTLEGDKKGNATIVAKGNVMVGNVHTKEGVYEIRYAGDGMHTITLIDPGLLPRDLHLVPTARSTMQRINVTPPVGERISTIDILVAYTWAALAEQEGGEAMENLIDLAIAETNQIFENSEIKIRLRLVKTFMFNQGGESGDIGTELTHLTDRDEFLTNIHPLREEHKADIVSLFVRNGGDACGIAWQLNSDTMEGFEAKAFSIVDTGCIGNYTLAHEIGHNLGGQHNRSDADVTPLYTYGYDYQDPNGEYRTVLSYGCPNNPSCEILPYFSIPAIRDGRRLGVTNQSDNARAMSATREFVANFYSASAKSFSR